MFGIRNWWYNKCNQHGELIALSSAGMLPVSYAELASRIHHYSVLLLQNGIQPGKRIIIISEKSTEYVAAILATLDLQCTYVPVDIHAPQVRINSIIQDAQADFIISNSLTNFSEVDFVIAHEDKNSLRILKRRLGGIHSDERVSYILYTSGSTGKPKGVVVSNKAASAFVRWGVSSFAFDNKTVTGSIAPFHFDLSVLDLFGTLSCGGRIHLFNSTEVKNARLMAELISRKKINLLYATPSFLAGLVQFGKMSAHNFSDLRKVLFAGEIFPVALLHQLMDRLPDARFYNLYGPTETNVCTYTEIIRDTERTKPYPIGLPCNEHQYEISSEGELLIGGPHVADGYFNDTEKTLDKFFEKNNMRWFRTGDIVSLQDNSQLIYIGRRDRMVKRRGFRIEPVEIEQAINRISGISRAAVINTGEQDSPRLTAVVSVSSTETKLSFIELTKLLRDDLPDYMLPDDLLIVDALPLTSSGKIDYQKLKEEIVTSGNR